MALQLFSNNAISTLASPITNTATSLSVSSGGGSLFPAANGTQYFIATLIKNGSPTTYEIIKVFNRTTDNFTTIVRGQEGTTPQAWNAGDTVALLPTAGGFANFTQFLDLQQQLTDYAIDTGTANAYSVTLAPLLTSRSGSTPIRFQAAHTNTGASTFNDGLGAVPLVFNSGAALTANTIFAGGTYTVFWAGTHYCLSGAADLSIYAPLNSPTFTGAPTSTTPSAGDNSTRIATTAFVDGLVLVGQSLASNGYYKFPGGFIAQWGTDPGLHGGDTSGTISFPIAFPSQCLGVSLTCTTGAAPLSLTGYSTSSFNWFAYAGDAAFGIFWIALGH